MSGRYCRHCLSRIADPTAASHSDDPKKTAPSELPAKFKQYSSTADGDAIPYAVIRAAWSALRERHILDLSDRSDPSEASGCHVLLPAPPEPPKKSAELEARLAELREAEEQRRYRELVRDVVPKGAKGRRATGAGGGVDDEEDYGGQGGSSYLASYSEQLGFGMHVVGVMFTCYLLGHYAASALIRDQPALHPVGGAVGLIFGMLLETTLFIIRTTQLEKQAKQRSKKAAKKQGVSVPTLSARLAANQGTETAGRSTGGVSVGSEEFDAVRQGFIELAGRRTKGAEVSGSSGGSIMRRRNVRQSGDD
ncbi:unnamed protein product [Closterium sp. Yama58-4]|nr:unnamed protein product [Closterium sp. Yama58-4]